MYGFFAGLFVVFSSLVCVCALMLMIRLACNLIPTTYGNEFTSVNPTNLIIKLCWARCTHIVFAVQSTVLDIDIVWHLATVGVSQQRIR